MFKYSFLIFHQEYKKFLEELRNVGVLHVVEKEVDITHEMREKYLLVKRFDKVIDFLEKHEPEGDFEKPRLSGESILNEIKGKQQELEHLQLSLEDVEKELRKVKPWGNFSNAILEKLKKENIYLQFFTSTKKKFIEFEKNRLPVKLISEQGSTAYFVLVQKGEAPAGIDAECMKQPEYPFSVLDEKRKRIETKIETIKNLFNAYSIHSVEELKRCKKELTDLLEFEKVVLNTTKEADAKLMLLEGWVPKTKKENIDGFLTNNSVLYFEKKPIPGDRIPVLLKNNRFSKLFEPIGSLFSLPDYAELDLTVFFAPFFMLFFGFCLGDAGYGLLFLVGAGVYKIKAGKHIKPYLSLIQFLGIATIIFGTISGTFFGINLIETETDWLDSYQSLFLDPNKMFFLSLILGAVQIIFGMFIRAANQIKQFGFGYALATFGWLIILLGSTVYVLLTRAGIIPESKTIWVSILSLGGLFILFFNDPNVNVFSRVGKGIWDVYSTVTGIFGDLLSYIRLFALGLSSAILGFVINDIGLQILGASKILGPVFFVLFLILGHTLNILISSLGSFVHPMRLTFVEFYKSAGFQGGGEQYKPFGAER